MAHPAYPDGLVYFDTNHNCVAILGLNYFGELKKATLTLAWGKRPVMATFLAMVA